MYANNSWFTVMTSYSHVHREATIEQGPKLHSFGKGSFLLKSQKMVPYVETLDSCVYYPTGHSINDLILSSRTIVQVSYGA